MRALLGAQMGADPFCCLKVWRSLLAATNFQNSIKANFVVKSATLVFVISTSGMDDPLDLVLDSDNNGVPKHLGEIADQMSEWEGPIAEWLDLTSSEIAGVKTEHPKKLRLQT